MHAYQRDASQRSISVHPTAQYGVSAAACRVLQAVRWSLLSSSRNPEEPSAVTHRHAPFQRRTCASFHAGQRLSTPAHQQNHSKHTAIRKRLGLQGAYITPERSVPAVAQTVTGGYCICTCASAKITNRTACPRFKQQASNYRYRLSQGKDQAISR